MTEAAAADRLRLQRILVEVEMLRGMSSKKWVLPKSLCTITALVLEDLPWLASVAKESIEKGQAKGSDRRDATASARPEERR